MKKERENNKNHNGFESTKQIMSSNVPIILEDKKISDINRLIYKNIKKYSMID